MHDSAPPSVYEFVSRLGAGVYLAVFGVLAAGQDLSRILHAVEQRYNNAQTLAVRFEQTYTAQKRRRTERGELFLRKPGRMRWEYSNPPGKLFVSDGKTFYLYTADNNRVEKTRFKGRRGQTGASLGRAGGRIRS